MWSDVRRREVALALGCLLCATFWLHVLHVVRGHAWFSAHGPLIAVALTVTILIALGPLRASSRLLLGSVLLGVLVVPEWLEGELSAQHPLDWTTLEGHGLATLAVVALAWGLVLLWEAARVITLIWPR